MTGKTLPAQMITPEEALDLFKHSTVEEIYRAKDLCDAYKEANPYKDADFQWKFFNLLSFIYSAGRIQGIREERAKKSA